ncbi:sodium-dependent phosphate transporter [Achlya hypogyna]|uniref:Sodium-dependent phosphate transporter n=1 Tax=Achlya hypogyna TaxID=1202772 RepID=A0A1V9ZIZ6_ACHHY|nr:sodium-dependent phosphate transporter [Achlya hypogyna]
MSNSTPKDEPYTAITEALPPSHSARILSIVGHTLAAFGALYCFLFAIKLLGDSLTLLFGCNTKTAFAFADNAIVGLMVGMVFTAILQSSSTVTSITVALVGAGGLSVQQSVPITMGANIGTCLTSTIVAFAQVGDKAQFERALAAGTVHDFYNIGTVLVLFPLELLLHPLERLATAMTGGGTGTFFSSPIDAILNPLYKLLLAVDKKTIEAVTAGTMACDDAQFLTAGVFYGSYTDGTLTAATIGGICLGVGLVLLVGALLVLVKTLQALLQGSAQRVISRVLDWNGYLNIAIGALVTFCVQSSSIVTSTLTPMAGLGVISLEQMYPLVIGANLGTTVTALLASLVTGSPEAVAVALVHFWFNVSGMLLFYPIPVMRKPIFAAARALGFASARYPPVAGYFLGTLFVLVPTIALGLTYLYNGSVAMVTSAIVSSAAIALATGIAAYWYMCKGGRARWVAFLEHKGKLRDEKRSHTPDV